MSFIQHIFRRYRDNNATHEEQQLVNGWYDHYDQEKDIQLTTEEAEDIKKSIRQKIMLSPALPVAIAATAPRRRIGWRYAAAAAAVLIITASVILWNANPPASGKKEIAALTTDVTTAAGIDQKLNMPDGSTLMVRPGSSIAYKTAFDGASREIVMHNGEVYFEIAKDSSRPFLIHTGTLDIKVLGTSFVVRAIKGVREQEVVVKEGRVQVANNGKVLAVLTAGNRLAFNTATGQFNVKQQEDQIAEQFHEGWLILNNQSFAELQTMLHNRYGILLQDPEHKLANAHFSTLFQPQSSIQHIMEILCAIHGVSYSINANVVTIH
jgi:ferric-dicitrate binding protein FerR (iron transport regulator)